jgi:hypothetical protein
VKLALAANRASPQMLKLVAPFNRHLGSSSQESGAFAILDFGLPESDKQSWQSPEALRSLNPKSKIQNRERYDY